MRARIIKLGNGSDTANTPSRAETAPLRKKPAIGGIHTTLQRKSARRLRTGPAASAWPSHALTGERRVGIVAAL